MRPPDHPDPKDWQARFSILGRRAKDPRLKTYYRTPLPSPHTPVSQIRFLALDLETTGLNPEADAIVSIGFIPMGYNRIFCQGGRHWIVRPEQAPDDPLARIHGITHSRLEASPGFDDCLAHLLRAMAGRIIVAHYSRIEREFLNTACMDLLDEPLAFPVVDTMVLEARKHPVYRPNFIQRWLGAKPSPSLRLSHARERYGLPRYRPHHALTDALATGELFMAQISDRYSPDTPVGHLWI